MRVSAYTAIVAVLVLSSIVSCDSEADGGVADGVSSRRQSILGGSVDSADEFPSVANIGFNGIQLCSASKVAPNWLLSAGHCFFENLNWGVSEELRAEDLAGFRVFFGVDGDTPAEGYPVEAVYVHPAFDPASVWGFAHDIALVRFTDDEAFPSSCWIGHPEQMEPVTYRDLKSEIAVVGFGVSTIENRGEGRRRQLHAGLDWICHDAEGCHIGMGYDWLPPGSLGMWEFWPPAGPHRGDSGGPLYVYRQPFSGGDCRSPAFVAGVYSHRPFPWGDPYQGCDPLQNPMACHSQAIAFIEVGAHADWINACVLDGECTGQVLP